MEVLFSAGIYFPYKNKADIFSSRKVVQSLSSKIFFLALNAI